MMNKKDILLAVCVLVAAGAGLLAVRLAGHSQGRQLRITVDGKEYGIWNLDEEQEIEVSTDRGYNRIEIRGNKACMKEADCPDGYCRRQGSISLTGETIICLPHRLVAEVLPDESGEEDVSLPDSVSE